MKLALPAAAMMGTTMAACASSLAYLVGCNLTSGIIARQKELIRELETSLALSEELLAQARIDVTDQANKTEKYMGELQSLTTRFISLTAELHERKLIDSMGQVAARPRPKKEKV